MALDVVITKVKTGTYKVELTGTLDTQTAPTFDRRMEPILSDPNVQIVILELHELTFVSSIGMGSIARIRRTVGANRGLMVTIGAQPQIVRVFDIVKLLPKETMFSSREEADEYLAAIQKQMSDENREPPKDVP